MTYAARLAVITAEEGRLSPRRSVNFPASMRAAGATAEKGRVGDLSSRGCKVRGFELEAGAEVWLKITGMNALRARVAWAEPGVAGLEFLVPIDVDVLEALARPRHRARPRALFGLDADL